LKKGVKIGVVVTALFFGICALPFLPITQHEFLKPYEKIVQLGSYDIDVKIILSDNPDETEMSVNAYFTYPAAQMRRDKCFIEVSVDIEGQTPQKYPTHVVGTKYERNFPIERTQDSSIRDTDGVEEFRRLNFMLYNEPIIEQYYTLTLKPVSDENSQNCKAVKIIKHKIRKMRASMFDVAMSV